MSRAMVANSIPVIFAALQVISAQGIFDNVEPMPPARSWPWEPKRSISNAIGEPHIVGGSEAIPHSNPHQAALRIEEDGKEYFCGGSLISDSWVLTAAHCVDGSPRVLVVLGAHNIQQNESTTSVIEADKIIIHPRWPDNRTDIAVLRLKNNVTLDGKYIDIIQLPSFFQRKRTFFWYDATMTGWGRTTDDNRDLSPVLRSVKTWIVSNYYCSFRYYFLLPSSEICASGYRAKGTCNGDSGGPLHIVEPDGTKTIVGITSWGHLKCELSWPPVFTRVTSYLDWIYETTNIAPRYK